MFFVLEGGERSFTTLVSDRSLAQLEYDNAVNDNGFKSEDHLTTAFGLAALMQNGFPPPGAILNSVNFPVAATTKGNPSEFIIGRQYLLEVSAKNDKKK